jgi:hypothetical protein
MECTSIDVLQMASSRNQKRTVKRRRKSDHDQEEEDSVVDRSDVDTNTTFMGIDNRQSGNSSTRLVP